MAKNTKAMPKKKQLCVVGQATKLTLGRYGAGAETGTGRELWGKHDQQ